jgi:hypothetical protein
MRLLILFVAALFFTQSLNAQAYVGGREEINALSRRKLMVLLESIPKSKRAEMQRSNNTEQLKAVEKVYSDFNTALQSAVEKSWETHRDVLYLTRDEFDEIPNSTRKEYVVLYFMTKKVASKSAGFIPLWRAMLWPEPEAELTHFNFSTLFQVCNIDRAEDFATAENRLLSFPVHSISLPEVFPGTISINYAIAALNRHFVRCNSAASLSGTPLLSPENRSRLAQKTLLICRDWLVNESDINKLKEIYPYPLRMVSAEELTAALVSGAPQYVWFVAIPEFDSHTQNRALRFRYQILGNADAELHASYYPAIGYIPNKATWSIPAGKKKMTPKILKRLVRSFGREKVEGNMER